MFGALSYPLLGAHHPDLAELRARTPSELRKVWETAAGLAAWRRGRISEADAALRSTYEVPFPWAAVRVDEHDSPSLEPEDLLRAILVEAGEWLEPYVSADRRADAGVKWRSRVLAPPEIRLSQSWRHRWARVLAGDGGDRALEPRDFLRAMPPRIWWALATWSDASTPPYWSIRERALAEGALGHPIAVASILPVHPPSWLPQLLEGPGLLLVGERGVGKRWMVHDALRTVERSLVHHFVDLEDEPALPSITRSGQDVVRVLCGLREIDPTLVENIAAALSGGRFRVVWCLTVEEHARALSAIPALGRFPFHHVPAPSGPERLARFLCLRPKLEDLMGREFGLSRWLAYPPRHLTFSLLRDLTDVSIQEALPAHQALRALLAPIPAPWSKLDVASEKGREQTLKRLRWRHLDDLIPDRATLDALVAIDTALSGGLQK